MPMYDPNDPVDQQNRKKRRKRVRTFAVLLLLAVLGSTLYATHDLWLPKLRGVGRQYQIIVNDGKLAGGNFPIETTGDSGYQLEYTGRELAVLNDACINFYNDNGTLIKTRQHAYTNPVMRSAGGRVLLYEHGGDEFSVEDGDAMLYGDTFEEGTEIMFARLSPEGYTAVVTTSENFDCEIFVYNRKGSVIYDRKCIERVSGIGFRDESSGCVISYLRAEKGSLVTSVQEVDFRENSELWTSPGIDALGLEVYGYDSGAFVLGIESCGYVDSLGSISAYYRYGGELAGGSSEEGRSAVIINNDEVRRYSLVLFGGGSAAPVTVEFSEPLVDVTVSGGLAYVMGKGNITAYDFEGAVRSTVEINDSYTGFVRSQKHIYLKGFTRIDRIDFES